MGDEQEWLFLLDPWLFQLIGKLGGPVILARRVGIPPFTPKDYFLEALAHEVAHWATVLWAEARGFDIKAIPPLPLLGDLHASFVPRALG